MSVRPELLERMIVTHADPKGYWSIPTSQALRELGVDAVTFYRRLYERRKIVDTIVPDAIFPENVITLAAGACADLESCERLLHCRGIVISSDDRVQIASIYIEMIAEAIALHQVDTDCFEAMKRSFHDEEIAFSRYVEHYFDLPEVRDRTIEAFLDAHPQMRRHIARASVERALDLLFTRHVLDIPALFAPLAERLGRRRFSRSRPQAKYEDAVAESLSVFGLTRLPDTLLELKRIYRSLMKTYHPDINASGLEISRRITTAFASLLQKYQNHL